jgi:hypothetical protein
VSEGLDSGLLEIDEPLQVVAGRHHRHRKVGQRLTDSAQQLNRSVLMALRGLIGMAKNRFQDEVVLPRGGRVEVFRGAPILNPEKVELDSRRQNNLCASVLI